MVYFWGVIGLLAFALVVALTLIFPKADNGWGQWLHDYQTLIASGFALVAAYITVTQVRLSDDEQDRRHRRQLAAVSRRDTLIVERFVLPGLKWIADDRSRMAAFVNHVSKVSSVGPEREIRDPLPPWSEVRADLLEFTKAVFSVRQFLGTGRTDSGDGRLKDVRPLFDAGLTEAFLRLTEAMTNFANMGINQPTIELAAAGDNAPEWYTPQHLWTVAHIWHWLLIFQEGVGELHKAMSADVE